MPDAHTLEVVPSLCHLRPPADSAPGLLRLMARRAQEEGYVAESFADALVERERAFPTGLPTPTPAAIPHADPEHVRRPGLSVALLDPPVDFGEMGSGERAVPCHLAVLLLVTDPHAQVELLGRLVTVLQRPDWLDQLAPAADPKQLAERFTGLLG